ncbi:MAG: hypothetical protein MZW92_21860 [Comamonadaceae bacterium]|nr:hypothetical protein [Comamonadaceae bacterium]
MKPATRRLIQAAAGAAVGRPAAGHGQVQGRREARRGGPTRPCPRRGAGEDEGGRRCAHLALPDGEREGSGIVIDDKGTC